jgi:hypothetical protein
LVSIILLNPQLLLSKKTLPQFFSERTQSKSILGYLQNNDEIKDSGDFAAERGIDHNEIVNVIKSLHGFRYVVDATVSNFFHISKIKLILYAIKCKSFVTILVCYDVDIGY